jgi:hypothetical protein
VRALARGRALTGLEVLEEPHGTGNRLQQLRSFRLSRSRRLSQPPENRNQDGDGKGERPEEEEEARRPARQVVEVRIGDPLSADKPEAPHGPFFRARFDRLEAHKTNLR